MRVYVEFEIEKMHCLVCPLREQGGSDNCVLQKNNEGCFIDFIDWQKQMKKCPLKEVE